MKVVCHGTELNEALLKVSKALPNKNINPVLEGIKISAKDDCITLYATDLDLAIEKKIAADVLIEGEAVVQGRKLSDLVRTLTNEQVELFLTERKELKVKYTDSEAYIPCYPTEEYPSFEKINKCEAFCILSKELKELIGKTLFAASTEDSRPVLKGCLLEVEKFSLSAIALDGYRLATAKKPLEKSTKEQNVIVPAKSLGELSKLLDDDDTIVTVSIEGTSLSVDFGHTALTTRLLSGEFINYKQIIPREFNTNITVSKEQLGDGVERASIFAKQDKNNLVKMDIKEKMMIISSATAAEEGKLKENISVSLEGKDISIAFNARYLADCMKAIDDEFIKINFTSPVAPCIITPCEGEEYMYLILPVRI